MYSQKWAQAPVRPRLTVNEAALWIKRPMYEVPLAKK